MPATLTSDFEEQSSCLACSHEVPSLERANAIVRAAFVAILAWLAVYLIVAANEAPSTEQPASHALGQSQ